MASSSSGKSGRATLTEVAARAGVSATTASLVLGGKAGQHRISEETLLRVRKAAEELDYSPNLLVRSLQRGRTHTLSFFNTFRHHHIDDIYMDRLSTAIKTAAGRSGYDVLVHCDFSRSPHETYRNLNGGRADGVLMFAPLPDDPLLPFLRSSRLPVVLINARDEHGVLPSVKDDVVSGMRQVAGRLIELGHRRIAAIVEQDGGVRDADERTRFLCQSLAELSPDGGAPGVVPVVGTPAATFHRLMAQPVPPTAIFCWRDWLAYDVLEACENMAIDVPGTLSIVGYDGVHWPAATRHTAASVKVDLFALAAEAVRLLDRCIEGQVEGAEEVSLPVVLQPGTTLGPASERSSTQRKQP